MISRNITKICKDFTKIENYSKAVLDTSQVWICHHRLETHYRKNGEWFRRDEDISVEQLIKDSKYFDVPASELIFMTIQEHSQLHEYWKKRRSKTNSGTWQEGHDSWNKGTKYTDEMLETNSFYAKRKRVRCVETGQVFESMADASEWL